MKYHRRKLLLKNYKILEPIAQGRFATIYLAYNLDNKRHYVVKTFNKDRMIKDKLVKRISWELRIISNIKGDMFPRFHGTSQTTSEFMIFMEYVPGGDFYFWETKMENISIASGQFYIGQIILMLDKLHQKKVIYRDLKPENLVLGADGYIRLVDFGYSVVVKTRKTRTYTLCGTPEFLSPEVLLKKGHTIAVDFWALGIFIFELFSKEGPFFDENPLKLYHKTIKTQYRFPEKFPERAKSIVRGLLVRKPNKRLGMLQNGIDDLKNNIFFKNFNWKDLIAKKLSPPILPNVKNDKDTTNFKIHEMRKELKVPIDSTKDPFILW